MQLDLYFQLCWLVFIADKPGVLKEFPLISVACKYAFYAEVTFTRDCAWMLFIYQSFLDKVPNVSRQNARCDSLNILDSHTFFFPYYCAAAIVMTWKFFFFLHECNCVAIPSKLWPHVYSFRLLSEAWIWRADVGPSYYRLTELSKEVCLPQEWIHNSHHLNLHLLYNL